MSLTTLWFIFGGILIAAEMLSGTFYLLVYGLACLIGGLCAWLGLPLGLQLASSALFAIGGTLLLRRRHFLKPASDPGSLDIGQRVSVQTWRSPTLLRVHYRGADWDGELLEPTGEPRPDTLYIQAQRGNTLILSPLPANK